MKDPLELEEDERKARELERVERIRKEREDAAAGREDPNLPVGDQAVFKHYLPRRPINLANTRRVLNGSAAH